MAKLVLLASTVILATVDRSQWATSAELAVDAEAKEVTTFASGGFKENLGGIKSGNIQLNWDNDLAVGLLDDTMWTLFLANAAISFEVRAVNTARSTSNPGYTGNLIITNWTPISGAVGDVNGFSVTYPTTGAIVRNVT